MVAVITLNSLSPDVKRRGLDSVPEEEDLLITALHQDL